MTATIEISIDSLVAQISLFNAFEGIIPTKFLPPLDDAFLVELLPWIFTKADVATRDLVWPWPRSQPEQRFKHFFRMLVDLPPGRKGLFENIERIDEKLDYDREECSLFALTDLISGVGEAVEEVVYRTSSLDDSRFYFSYYEGGRKMSYMIGNRKFKDAPKTLGCVCLISRLESERLSTPVLSYTHASENDTLRTCLEGKIKVILGQLVKNIRRLELPYGQFQDQEVFVLGTHGPFFHIIRAFFSAETMESVQMDKTPGPHTFGVTSSNEYNLLVKNDCLEAFRGLVGLFRYLLSGEASVGAMQVAFSLSQAP